MIAHYKRIIRDIFTAQLQGYKDIFPKKVILKSQQNLACIGKNCTKDMPVIVKSVVFTKKICSIIVTNCVMLK